MQVRVRFQVKIQVNKRFSRETIRFSGRWPSHRRSRETLREKPTLVLFVECRLRRFGLLDLFFGQCDRGRVHGFYRALASYRSCKSFKNPFVSSPRVKKFTPLAY